MSPLLLLAVQVAAPSPTDADQDEAIVVTASRVPQEQRDAAASTTVFEHGTIERIGEPLLSSLIRLTPSAATAANGPAGSFTEVRIRGAEANHTLLFIDGIRANDPAANETPRFELLSADIASHVEVVRGPQSALWGSEAIGGVIAVEGIDTASPVRASAESGSYGFGRASASAGYSGEASNIAGAIGWQRATGIDSFNGEGDREGYRNLSARLHGSWRPVPLVELGLSAFRLTGRSEFDGLDPFTFVHADTLDSTRNRLSAGRLSAKIGSEDSGLSGMVGSSLLRSSNRNFLASDEINRTSAERWTANAQLQYRFATGAVAHTAVLAFDRDAEHFAARDVVYGGASNQDRRRTHGAVTAELRSEGRGIVTDIALRRDEFSDFKDATTLRASALVRLGRGFSIAGSYGEGIAQPTFFDLYGFFPGLFAGNPRLTPEESRGFEASLRYSRGAIRAALTGYRQRLHGEIVDASDPITGLFTTVNRADVSHRTGVEVEFGWAILDAVHLSANYAFLDATEPTSGPAPRLREVRRPKHSGSVAIDGKSGRLSYGAYVSYSGARIDNNFDVFPAERVRLGSYWLAGARAAYSLRPGLEIFARGSNLLDAQYQEVFGYRTEGRALYAGVRLGGR